MTKRVGKNIKIEAITKSRQNNVYMLYIRTQSRGQSMGKLITIYATKKKANSKINIW